MPPENASAGAGAGGANASNAPVTWEALKNEHGLTYYKSSKNGALRWSDPRAKQAVFEEHEDVKYSNYRIVLKLNAIQIRTKLTRVNVRYAIESFHQHAVSGRSNRLLDIPTMRSCLTTMYENAPDAQHTADLAVHFFLCVYDSGFRARIKAMDFQTAIIALCSGSVEDKAKYAFTVADDNSDGYVTRSDAEVFLVSLQKLIRFIDEDMNIGATKEGIVRDVNAGFKQIAAANSNPEDNDLLTEEQFVGWITGPALRQVSWFITLARYVIADATIHTGVTCHVCGQSDFRGLRYSCIKCFGVDLCQTCFFHGKEHKKHKSYHPFIEYCLKKGVGSHSKDFMRRVRNLNKSYKHKRLRTDPFGRLETDTGFIPTGSSPTVIEAVADKDAIGPYDAEAHRLIAEYAGMLSGTVSVGAGVHRHDLEEKPVPLYRAAPPYVEVAHPPQDKASEDDAEAAANPNDDIPAYRNAPSYDQAAAMKNAQLLRDGEVTAASGIPEYKQAPSYDAALAGFAAPAAPPHNNGIPEYKQAPGYDQVYSLKTKKGQSPPPGGPIIPDYKTAPTYDQVAALRNAKVAAHKAAGQPIDHIDTATHVGRSTDAYDADLAETSLGPAVDGLGMAIGAAIGVGLGAAAVVAAVASSSQEEEDAKMARELEEAERQRAAREAQEKADEELALAMAAELELLQASEDIDSMVQQLSGATTDEGEVGFGTQLLQAAQSIALSTSELVRTATERRKQQLSEADPAKRASLVLLAKNMHDSVKTLVDTIRSDESGQASASQLLTSAQAVQNTAGALMDHIDADPAEKKKAKRARVQFEELVQFAEQEIDDDADASNRSSRSSVRTSMKPIRDEGDEINPLTGLRSIGGTLSQRLTLRRKNIADKGVTDRWLRIKFAFEEDAGIDLSELDDEEVVTDLPKKLTDGVLALTLANAFLEKPKYKPNVPKEGQAKMPHIRVMENVDRFLQACKELGVPERDLCSYSDMIDGNRPVRVLACMEALLVNAAKSLSRRNSVVSNSSN